MRCVEFENRLNEVLDERGSPDLDMLLASHAHHCEPCQQLLARYELVCETAGNLPAPKLPAGFAERVVGEFLRQHLASGGSRRRSMGLPRAVALFALAAVLLIAVLPLLGGKRPVRLPTSNGTLAIETPGTGEVQNTVAQDTPEAAPSSPVGPASVASGQSRDPAAEHYADLAKETGSSLAAAVLYLPGVGNSLAGGESTFEQPRWVGQVSDGLRPVTASMSDALHVLLRVIPSSDSPKHDGAS